MSHEEHAKQIIHLPLVPVRAVEEVTDGRDGRRFIRVSLHADPSIVPDAEEVVDDFEAVVAGRVVDGGDVADLGELGGSMEFEVGHDGNHAGGRDVDGQFIFPDGEPGVYG